MASATSSRCADRAVLGERLEPFRRGVSDRSHGNVPPAPRRPARRRPESRRGPSRAPALHPLHPLLDPGPTVAADGSGPEADRGTGPRLRCDEATSPGVSGGGSHGARDPCIVGRRPEIALVGPMRRSGSLPTRPAMMRCLSRHGSATRPVPPTRSGPACVRASGVGRRAPAQCPVPRRAFMSQTLSWPDSPSGESCLATLGAIPSRLAGL
jgi:hypothetical protein